MISDPINQVRSIAERKLRCDPVEREASNGAKTFSLPFDFSFHCQFSLRAFEQLLPNEAIFLRVENTLPSKLTIIQAEGKRALIKIFLILRQSCILHRPQPYVRPPPSPRYQHIENEISHGRVISGVLRGFSIKIDASI